MDIPILKCFFAFVTFNVVFLGFLVGKLERFIPVFILKVYKYGKFEYVDGSEVKTIQVPKRWFRHFYVVAVITSTFSLCLTLGVYFKFVKSIPELLLDYFFFCGADGNPTGTATTSLIAIVLLTLQCYKRFYETHYVSVFSDAKMDISHYLLGHLHYIGAFTALLSEAPGIMQKQDIELQISDISWLQIISIAIYLWACYSQLRVSLSLARMRKNKKGDLITTKHVMPQGGLFELVSCPHMFCEIVMYVTLNIIAWENSAWLYITLWVVSNQVSVALFTHSWYKKEFQQYPKQRRAIIPYIL